MKTDKPVLGTRNFDGIQRGIMLIREEDPDAWLVYLSERHISPKAAQRRINQLRASKAAALHGCKSDL